MAAAQTADPALAADYALRVEAPTECADEARVLEAIRARSPGFTPAVWDATAANRFVVRFLPQASGVLVELETTDASGARSLRSVPAQDCPEAVRASAWILTLLMDPAAAAPAEPATAEPATAEPAPTEPATAEPAAEASIETRSAPETTVSGAAPSPVRPRPSTANSRTRASSGPSFDSPVESDPSPRQPRLWQIGVGAFGGVLQSGLPDTPFGFGAFVEAAWERKSWLRPSARLAGLDAGSGVGHTERGDVEVSWIGARLSLCPVRSSRTRLASVRLCALGELGKLTGDGQATTSPGTATPTWYATGPALGVELQPWSFLALELEAAVLFPFNRDRFVFEADPVVVGYEVPPVSLSLALGLAARF